MGGNEKDAELAVRIVVAEGILSGDEAGALRDEAARAGQGLLERLRADGRISQPTFASLHANMTRQAKEELGEQVTVRDPAGARARDQADQARTWDQLPAPGSSPGDRADPEAFPVPGWDRYEPIRLLGQGGMGRVFLAKDLRLGRNVAIKFVRGDDPELAGRIVGEARAQARVNDERVCKVYEVGEVRGRVYIAMQHIDGRPLSELTDELTLEQKAIVLRGAALGVAEAHRAGLIHRDLKPSNIMVERGADGELRPFVMDFGLARDWADGTTMTGTVLGTPQYMAPEQARGEVKQLDRRADVYSLGATLYALLVGRAPIEGPNPLAVLTRVALDEPTRPRAIDPDVPADLEAIVMKCLEKERTARYDSARALADDLGRFLGGEPVAARSSAGVGYRLRKWLRRRARLVAAAAVAVVLIAVALGYTLHERRQAARREVLANRQAARSADLARQFTERVKQIESMARYGALAPAHDLRPDRDRLRSEMGKLEDEVRDGGELAEGPGHYALGLGYLALGDDDRAAAELATARKRDYDAPRVAYALALAQGQLYQRALREVERADLSKEQRAQRRGEVEQAHRDPALRYLREIRGPEVASPAPEEKLRALHVAALIAFYESQFDDALARLDEIDRGGYTGAWFYEAPLLRGEVLHARARERAEARTEQGAAAADLEAGRRALEAAAAIGESAPEVYAARAELERTAIGVELYGGGDVDAPFKHGVEAAERVLALLPDDAGALVLRARFRRSLAEHRGRRGEEVTALLAEAVADAKRAIKLDPKGREGRLVLVSIYKSWGEVNSNPGQDPGEQLGEAVKILDAIDGAERDAEFYLLLGLVHTVWANYQDDAGQDSLVHRVQAVGAYKQAVQIDDGFGIAWLSLGDNYRRQASRLPGLREIAARVLAGNALARGRALEPKNFLTYLYDGDMYSELADRERDREASASARAQAIERYRQGAVVNPRNPIFPISISYEHLQQADEVRKRGHDPLPALAEAAAAARRTVEVAPDQGLGYINLGAALLDRADYQQYIGADPMPAAHAAKVAIEKAIKLLPNRPANWKNLVDLHLLFAKIELDRGRDPRASLKLAEDTIDHASNPMRQADVRERREKIHALLGRW